MKIICPKCQFENQADSVRVVCGRCATIIEVRIEQNLELDADGNRRTAGLPISNSRLDNKAETANTFQATAGQSANDTGRGSFGSSLPPLTPQEDNFDNVLELPSNPRTPTGFQESSVSGVSGFDSPTVYDDVFSTSGYDLPDDFKSSPGDRSPAMPVDNNYSRDEYQPDEYKANEYRADEYRANEYREPHRGQDSFPPRDQEFMGWPVLPDSSAMNDEDEVETGQLSSGRGGIIGRILVAALVSAVLIFGAYYFFGGYFQKKKNQEVADTSKSESTENSSTSSNNSNGVSDEAAGLGDTKKTVPILPSDPPAVTDSAAQSQVADTPLAASPPAVSVPDDGKYTLQVASLADQNQANEKISQFKSKGVDARVVKAEVEGKGIRYRIYVGGFADRSLAQKFGEDLVRKTNGLIKDFLVTQKN